MAAFGAKPSSEVRFGKIRPTAQLANGMRGLIGVLTLRPLDTNLL
jgi:hypothetical protein